MRRFLLASAGIMAVATWIGAAAAADLSRPYPYPSRPAPAPVYSYAYNWSGPYAGINGGFGWGSSSWNGIPASFDVNGGMFGGQIGYNWMFGGLVVGLEGDADWTDLRGSTSASGCPGGPCTTKNDFLSTARGRIGLAADRWMPYFTGGFAFGNIRTTTPGLTGIDQTNGGWAIGGGLEGAMVGNWTARAEYLYVNLGSAGCAPNCGLPANNVSFTTNIFRGGLNYRF
jgi:outer membrane immunogenic protein